ncbi:RidA family protein [Sulfitobacter sp.]|uniref:RidA family protein n=1 Tax=Sulfitobacter sp. TaxID=1903071 RepID=UPI0030020E1F
MMKIGLMNMEGIVPALSTYSQAVILDDLTLNSGNVGIVSKARLVSVDVAEQTVRAYSEYEDRSGSKRQ